MANPAVENLQTDITVIQKHEYGEMGPLMQALPSDRMRAFVVNLLDNSDQTRAAAEAGYSAASPGALRVTGHRLAHDDRILAAMQEEGKRRLRAGVGSGISYLLETIDNSLVSPKDRLRAVDMLFNRIGLPATTEVHHEVEHKLNDKQVTERIAQLAKKHGLDPQKLLGENVVEGEFVDITPEEDWAAL